jgi:hypothetical protein
MVGTGEIPRVKPNQHHCLVEKGKLQRLREETPTENQPDQRFRCVRLITSTH